MVRERTHGGGTGTVCEREMGVRKTGRTHIHLASSASGMMATPVAVRHTGGGVARRAAHHERWAQELAQREESATEQLGAVERENGWHCEVSCRETVKCPVGRP